jgi:hypothetical protein
VPNLLGLCQNAQYIPGLNLHYCLYSRSFTNLIGFDITKGDPTFIEFTAEGLSAIVLMRLVTYFTIQSCLEALGLVSALFILG